MIRLQQTWPGANTSCWTSPSLWRCFRASSNPLCSVLPAIASHGPLRPSCTCRCLWLPPASVPCRSVLGLEIFCFLTTLEEFEFFFFFKGGAKNSLKWNYFAPSICLMIALLAFSEGFAVSQQDCLRLFSKEEKLTDNNKVFCRHCKAHRDSTKKLEIWKVPPILLVHLKRSVALFPPHFCFCSPCFLNHV